MKMNIENATPIKLFVNTENKQLGDVCILGTKEQFAQVQPCGTLAKPDNVERQRRAVLIVESVNQHAALKKFAQAIVETSTVVSCGDEDCKEPVCQLRRALEAIRKEGK